MSSSESDFETAEVNNLVYIMTLNKVYSYQIITKCYKEVKNTALFWSAKYLITSILISCHVVQADEKDNITSFTI
jgi:hypothetical protein